MKRRMALALLIGMIGFAAVYAATGSVVLTDHTDVTITPGNYIDVTAAFTLNAPYDLYDDFRYSYTSTLTGRYYDGDTVVTSDPMVIDDDLSILPQSSTTRNRSTLVPSLPDGFWVDTVFYEVNPNDWEIEIKVIYSYRPDLGGWTLMSTKFLIWNVVPPA